MFKRCLALLMCLFLLPVSAFADEYTNVPAARFRITFDMDADQYQTLTEYMPGIADLFNVTTLEGQLCYIDGDFDLQMDVLLNEAERTRTDVHLFGTEDLWHVRSSLLGNETLTLDMHSFLEFALKGYSHLGIPFQRVAILATPFVHTAPLRRIVNPILYTIYAEPGAHSISIATLRDMAQQVRQAADNNPQFGIWTEAIAMETGYDGYLADLVLNMPDWIETFIPQNDFSVTLNSSTETWGTKTLDLFVRERNQSGGQSVTVTLPPMTDGSVITLDAALQPDGDLYHGSFNLHVVDSNEDVILNLHTEGSLPTQLPVTRDFSLTWDAEGPMVGGEGVHLLFEGEPTDTGVVIRQWTRDHNAVMLTINAELSMTQTSFSSDLEGESIYVLSVSSETLSDLMNRIKSPLFFGLLPVIAQAPISSCQTLMNLMEHSGVFALLTQGIINEEEYWEEEWDEESEAAWRMEWEDSMETDSGEDWEEDD